VEVAPAFNYARNTHATSIVDDDSIPFTQAATKQKKALFESADLTLDLRYVAERTVDDEIEPPVVHLTTLDLSAKGHKGLAVKAFISLVEGQAVTFVLRNPPGSTNNYASPKNPASKPQTVLNAEDPPTSIVQGPGSPVDAVDNHLRNAGVGITAVEGDGLVSRARPHNDPFLTKVCLIESHLLTCAFTYFMLPGTGSLSSSCKCPIDL
jgi:hypothetical protein